MMIKCAAALFVQSVSAKRRAQAVVVAHQSVNLTQWVARAIKLRAQFGVLGLQRGKFLKSHRYRAIHR
jgi:hypothetical protein